MKRLDDKLFYSLRTEGLMVKQVNEGTIPFLPLPGYNYQIVFRPNSRFYVHQVPRKGDLFCFKTKRVVDQFGPGPYNLLQKMSIRLLEPAWFVQDVRRDYTVLARNTSLFVRKARLASSIIIL